MLLLLIPNNFILATSQENLSLAVCDQVRLKPAYSGTVSSHFVPRSFRTYFGHFVPSNNHFVPRSFHTQFGHFIISSQSLNLGGCRGTIDDVATIPFHPSLSTAAIRESPNPIPIHSLMLSSHLFFCLPLLLAPFTVPCRTVFTMPEDLEMWPYHLSFLFLTMVRRSSCIPIAFWILLRTSSLVTWSL